MHVRHLDEILYLIAVWLYIFISWLTTSCFQNFFGIDYKVFRTVVFGVAALCLVIKYFSQNNSLKEHAIVFSIGILFLISAYISGNNTLLWIYIFIVASRGISLRAIVYSIFWATILAGAIVITSFFLGIIPEFALTDNVARGARHSLGFSHPNSFAGFVFTLALAWLSLRYEAVKWFDIVIIAACAILSFQISGSRTVLLAFVLLLFWAIIRTFQLKRKASFSRWHEFLSLTVIVLIVAAILVSLFAMVLYDPSSSIWTNLDKISSNRLRLAHYYWQNNGITLFGNDFANNPLYNYGAHGEATTFLVDNLFAQILLAFGFIPAVISLLGIGITVFKLRKKEYSLPFYGIAILLLLGVTESFFILIRVNLFISCCRIAIYGDEDDLQNPSIFDNWKFYRKLCGIESGRVA